VRIPFVVGDTPCEFRRDQMWGKTELSVGNQIVVLQSPTDPATHVSLELSKAWECQFGDHLIRIEKTRPLLFAGFRPHDYRVVVDGQVVAQEHGF